MSWFLDEKEDLEKTALLCLQMIEVALEKQEEFLNVLRGVTQSSSITITPLDQLLLGINPQTQAADYLLKITRCAVRILNYFVNYT